MENLTEVANWSQARIIEERDPLDPDNPEKIRRCLRGRFGFGNMGDIHIGDWLMQDDHGRFYRFTDVMVRHDFIVL